MLFRSDLVFDVRFLPNPYYIDELKPLTGNDKPIKEYVMGFDIAHQFLEKLTDMIEFLIPNYILEGKNRLVIAIGCTGGRHRSVTLANELYNRLEGGEYGIKIDHRDINLDGLLPEDDYVLSLYNALQGLRRRHPEKGLHIRTFCAAYAQAP